MGSSALSVLDAFSYDTNRLVMGERRQVSFRYVFCPVTDNTLYEAHSIRCINGRYRATDRSNDRCRSVDINDYDEEYQLSCRAQETRWQPKESGKNTV